VLIESVRLTRRGRLLLPPGEHRSWPAARPGCRLHLWAVAPEPKWSKCL